MTHFGHVVKELNDSMSEQLALSTVVDPSQIPAIHALYTSAHADGLWPTNPTLDSLTRRLDTALLTLTLTNPTTTPPIPAAILLLTGSPSDPLLEDLIVAAEWRRGGLGRRLVAAMMERVREGVVGGGVCQRVECYCGWGVKGFYERCGFVMVRGEEGGRCLMRWVVSGS